MTTNTVVRLSIERPQRISEVAKWADLAFALGFPEASTVDISMAGTLSVSAFLPQVSVPESADEAVE